jgi:formate hydrogenlyase subunit 3/multisubunit Na+/H+ antiporter MnhD subunit
MKVIAKYTLLFILLSQTAIACPVCEQQQPKITKGWTHGAGPQSNWDWVIIGIISVITILTFIYSLKYLIKPKEKNTNHIKHLILNNE